MHVCSMYGRGASRDDRQLVIGQLMRSPEVPSALRQRVGPRLSVALLLPCVPPGDGLERGVCVTLTLQIGE